MDPSVLYKLIAESLRYAPKGEVPPILRLRIYDALCTGPTISSLVKAGAYRFDPAAGDYTLYMRLAVATARHVLPIWESRVASYLMGSELRDLHRFPHDLLDAAELYRRGALAASSFDEVLDRAYHTLGGLPYFMDYNAVAAAEAAYDSALAAKGLVPFTRLPLDIPVDEATDRELDRLGVVTPTVVSCVGCSGDAKDSPSSVVERRVM
jgi:hypothetical protein